MSGDFRLSAGYDLFLSSSGDFLLRDSSFLFKGLGVLPLLVGDFCRDVPDLPGLELFREFSLTIPGLLLRKSWRGRTRSSSSLDGDLGE